MKTISSKRTDGKIKRLFKDAKYRFSLLEERQKIIGLSLTAFVFVCLIAGLCIPLFSKKSSVKLYVQNVQTSSDSMLALERFARRGVLNKAETAHFKFTDGQIAQINEFYQQNGSASVCLRLEIMPSKKQLESMNETIEEQNLQQSLSRDYDFSYGLLNTGDFNKRGKFTGKSTGRILVKSRIAQIIPAIKKVNDSSRKNASFTFEVAIALKKNNEISEKEIIAENIPLGFCLNSPVKTRVLGVYVTGAKVGFDYSSDLNYYGFPSSGGMLDFYTQAADFSGCYEVFPVRYTKKYAMPEIEVRYFKDSVSDDLQAESLQTENSSRKEYGRIHLNIGGENIIIKRIEGLSSVKLPAAAFNKPFSRVDITKGREQVSCVLMIDGDASERIAGEDEVPSPVKTDPGLILNWNFDCWRNSDYEFFEWDRFPGILFFDIRTLEIQEKFFTRLAFFVEKQGYKGRILTNEELEGKHGYNAHDYSSESMARFFNKVYDIGFKLNDEEILLKKILLANGFLSLDTEVPGHVKGENKGLVSISRETPGWSRVRLLAHEGWHTLFFTSEEFRNFVAATYYTMDPSSRDFLIGFFRSQKSLGYDINDAYLMKNEFMAYVMQQPLKKVSEYFTGIAGWGSVMKAEPELSAYIRETNARGFEDAAVMLDDFVHDKWGIECGNIALVEKR